MSDEHTPHSTQSLLSTYGWSDDRAAALTAVRGSQPKSKLEAGRIVFDSYSAYRVVTSQGEFVARLSGGLRQEAKKGKAPVVGDWVAVEVHPDGTLVIQAILPRYTRLSRKVAGHQTSEQVVATNVDTVFLVMGLDGDFNLRRLERLVVMAWESGGQPVVVLTKADLHEDPVGARLDAQLVAPGVAVFVVSAVRGEGLEPLHSLLEPGRTVALIGSSGAGKSTLLNHLCGEEVMRTGEVRVGDDRGQHTTTHRQLVLLPSGGLLIDNPGMREIQLWADEEALAAAFNDIAQLATSCRFRDCGHQSEPGCEVLAAAADGRLAADRLQSWQKLQRELQSLERRREVATSRQDERRLSKVYKRIQGQKIGRR